MRRHDFFSSLSLLFAVTGVCMIVFACAHLAMGDYMVAVVEFLIVAAFFTLAWLWGWMAE